MKISYKWLQKFINLDKSPEEIAEKLTACSFEVEEIIDLGKGFNNVVIGEVMEKTKHPNADKLNLLKVKVSQDEILDIVCGAPNVEVGQKVPVALIGAKLPCGLEIAERKVRGEKSCGMVCAEDELGLGENHEGIMVLDEKLEIGSAFAKSLSLDDIIFDIDILPNRAHDCLCHYGVAREISALFDLDIEKFDMNEFAEVKTENSDLTIDVQDKESCRRYSAIVMEGVKVGESSGQVKSLLSSCELNAINNIVDITNYIMFSFGQPMHAFDADKVGNKIVVRKARKEEKIVALDENEYELDVEDLVICDGEKPIAIAGVIGGKDSAVGPETKRIIFEAANFEETGVRKTSQRLKISTDSSHRFERNIDPSITLFALKQAVQMTEELGGKSVGNVLDFYENIPEEKKIQFDFSKIENLLGVAIEEKRVLEILSSLDFKAVIDNRKIDVTVPTYRIDVEKANDVIEEIARVYGYDKIYKQEAQVSMLEVEQDRSWKVEKGVKSFFEGAGFFEVYNRSFLSDGDLEILGYQDRSLELMNYLTEDAKFFRSSLMVGLLDNVKQNLKNRDSFDIFEIGNVALIDDKKVLEKRCLAGVMCSREVKGENVFYSGKGVVDSFLDKAKINDVVYQKISNTDSFWHMGRSAEVLSGSEVLGRIGEIDPRILEKKDIDVRLFYFEFDMDMIIEKAYKPQAFKKINKLPVSEFDISAIFDKGISWQEVKKSINLIGDEHIIDVYPFDVYEGSEIGDLKKSVAFRVVLQSTEKTLEDGEIKGILDKVMASVEKIGGEVRK